MPGLLPDRRAASALGPLEAAGLLEGDVIVDAKSGVSGAGKAPTERTHFSENHGSVAAYALFSHRHTPEIEQGLGGRRVTFVPHLVPLDRGILEKPLRHGALTHLLVINRYSCGTFFPFNEDTIVS